MKKIEADAIEIGMIIKEYKDDDHFLIVINKGTREDDWGDTYYFTLLECDENLNPLEPVSWEWVEYNDCVFLYGTVNVTYNLENIVWNNP